MFVGFSDDNICIICIFKHRQQQEVLLNRKTHQRNVFSLHLMVGFVFTLVLLSSESKNGMWLVLSPGPVQAGFHHSICRFVLDS